MEIMVGVSMPTVGAVAGVPAVDGVPGGEGGAFAVSFSLALSAQLPPDFDQPSLGAAGEISASPADQGLDDEPGEPELAETLAQTCCQRLPFRSATDDLLVVAGTQPGSAGYLSCPDLETEVTRSGTVPEADPSEAASRRAGPRAERMSRAQAVSPSQEGPRMSPHSPDVLGKGEASAPGHAADACVLTAQRNAASAPGAAASESLASTPWAGPRAADRAVERSASWVVSGAASPDRQAAADVPGKGRLSQAEGRPSSNSASLVTGDGPLPSSAEDQSERTARPLPWDQARSSSWILGGRGLQGREVRPRNAGDVSPGLEETGDGIQSAIGVEGAGHSLWASAEPAKRRSDAERLWGFWLRGNALGRGMREGAGTSAVSETLGPSSASGRPEGEANGAVWGSFHRGLEHRGDFSLPNAAAASRSLGGPSEAREMAAPSPGSAEVIVSEGAGFERAIEPVPWNAGQEADQGVARAAAPRLSPLSFEQEPSTRSSAPPQPAHQVIQAVRLSVSPLKDRISVQLEPESLGRVQLILTREPQGLVASFRVETPEAHQALTGEAPALRRELESQGVALVRVSVEMEDGATGRRDAQDGRRRVRKSPSLETVAPREPGEKVDLWGRMGFETRV